MAPEVIAARYNARYLLLYQQAQVDGMKGRKKEEQDHIHGVSHT